MGLFSKKPKIAVCEMCGKADIEGCGEAGKHVEQITADQPVWLPANFRAQGQDEFTWMCTRCDSFPGMKWPSDGGAWAGMILHLGKAHRVGLYASGGSPVEFQMVPIGGSSK